MNINAKQINELATSRFDITTALSFFGQMKAIVERDATLVTTLDTVWTTYTAAYTAFDDAYAQTRKWMQTEDIETLDKTRDSALSAYLNALKSMTQSPNAAKQQAAKLLQFIREKYQLAGSDEYMKETTAIQQMVQEVEGNAQATEALQTTGLDDWFQDLKAKNEAFLAKMNERTEAQAGQQTGIVREKRLSCEAAYRNVVKLINALAICEVPAGFNYTTVIDLMNAELEHYRQILARKGKGSGGGGDTPTPTPTPSPDDGGDDDGGGGDDQGGGGDDQGGGDDPTPTPTPTPDPDDDGDGD